MKIMVCILLIICAVLTAKLWSVKRQLAEWLEYLREIKDAPERKIFVPDGNILAEINYEINDIMERNRKQFQRLTKAEEANKQILTNLSHDIRTPLTSLLGYLEALEQGRVKEGAEKEYIHVAYRKALNLKELVDMLFEWFQINSGERAYQMEACDVNELTREVIIGYLPDAGKRNVTLRADISDEEYFVSLDRIGYTRILNNLLQNALRHGNCANILIRIWKKEDAVWIDVENDGEGISEEQFPYLFNRLYKGDASHSGSGLGLAIVSELAAAMHGTVTVESRTGLGTVFHLSFPMQSGESCQAASDNL